jgi:hypothetical protein
MVIIYSITSTKGDKVYIGRTKQKLFRRKAGHKFNKNRCCSSILFNEYGFENCIFTVLEECTDEQGCERERYYIETTANTVNRQTPGRTDQEYREATQERIRQYRKEYYTANKEKNEEHTKAYYQANKERICERSKIYYSKNKTPY